MKQAFRCCVMLAAVIFATVAGAITPSQEEVQRKELWLRQNTAEGVPPPYSFTVNGEAARGAQSQHPSLEPALFVNPFPGTAACLLRGGMTGKGAGDSALLGGFQVLDVVFPVTGERAALHHALGDMNSAQSFEPAVTELAPGMAEPLVFAPTGGRSSEEQMPYFNLDLGGGGIVIAIGWAGQWQASFQRVAEGVAVKIGQQDVQTRLHPGETIRTPGVVLQFWEGADPNRGNNLFRQWMLEHNLPKRDGEVVLAPICGSVVQVEPDGSYEKPHVAVMEPLARLGFEVFWSDMDPQQWYPIGFPDGTGTWEPDPVKYPRGMKPVGDAAHANGLKYLLWFEPERVVRGTRIDQDHPEWVTYLPNPKNTFGLFRFDLPEARAWLTDYIDKQITEGGVDWLRWDFNIQPLRYWQKTDAPDRKGMTELRHVEGLYAMWAELITRHPGLVVDICASGGRRLDYETLQYGLPLWHSDRQCFGPDPEADQVQNGGLFPWIPLHGCGNFGIEPSYLFRSGMTTGNILVAPNTYALSQASDPQAEYAIRKTVALYTKLRPYYLGDFYPLFPHSAAKDVWYGYQFHREDLGAGFAVLFRREQCGETTEVALRGLDSSCKYTVLYEDSPDTSELDASGGNTVNVRVPTAPGASILYYRKSGS